ncbi:helix-turn-helix transcriptional regulator [Nocardioides sambongensis]|uniref:helix-turn-helix transcriptional regulator n=1 Tax=Nocardioides sambongensis TaxID=2589074 RepID=UPI0015E85F44|nr:helix-turn-helix transcriptional regulator [Nocardioides sambongensis]
MIGRSAQLSDALGYLAAGVDVVIEGVPGSGRSTFLTTLGAELEDDGAEVVRVAGIAGLRDHPLAALDAQLRSDGGPRLTGAITAVVDRLSELASSGRFVLMIDDADALDDASWGVILTAQSSSSRAGSSQFNIVSSNLLSCESGPRQIERLHRAYDVRLSAMRLDEFERLMTERADGPIDKFTLSRLYAKSAGLPGLGIGLVDVGCREGRLVRHRGVWTATSDLWSPTLRRLVERQIAHLTGRERKATQLLSLAGPVSMAEAEELIGRNVLDRLERKGLLRFTSTGGVPKATVTPPLVSEQFRHSVGGFERNRTLQHLERLAPTSPVEDGDLVDASPSERDALFVRTVHEHARARLAEARATWRRTHTATTALGLLDALSMTGAPESEIETVTHEIPIDSPDWLRVRLWDAERRATSGQYSEILDELSVLADSLGGGDLLRARATILRIQTDHVTLPPDLDPESVVERMARTATAADVAAYRLERARAGIAQGRFRAAGRELDLLDGDEVGLGDLSAESLRCLVLLGEGDHAQALRRATEGLAVARDRRDARVIQKFSYVAALCAFVSGDYANADRFVESALATGIPSGVPQGPALGLLCIGSVLAGRLGHADLARARVADARRIGGGLGPFPAMSADWAQFQILLADGHPDQAFADLRATIDRLYAGGARWSAAMADLLVTELRPDPADLDGLGARLSGIEGAFVGVLHHYVAALALGEPDDLLKTVPGLATTGRPGFAVNAYEHAGRILRDHGRDEEAEEVAAELERFRSSLPTGGYDATRFRRVEVLLSERELEIAHMVQQGRSNPEIAAALFLSVRTVESHVRSIMRKLGISSRSALIAYVAATGSL